jgi:branched-chain amino acid transport system substrate-binding protein
MPDLRPTRHAARRRAAVLTLLLAGLCAAPLASAQILVGQTSGFTGPVAAGVKENTDGARLVIDAVNARGGVNGQKIELVTMDDAFDPKKAAENARVLITERNVVALFLNRGTPHTEAIRPLLAQYQVPLVAPSTGAMVLHQPVDPWIFNVRATYQREADKAVRHLALLGMTRIALVHVDDSFGADGAAGAMTGFAAAKLQPLMVSKFNRAKPDTAPIMKEAAQKDAQAVLFFGAAAVVAQGTKELREAGSRAQVVTLSNNASGGFIQQMGVHARGTIVTQVFPNERAVSVPLVREAVALAQAKGMTGVTPAMMEGFAAAKVLVEGLRRAGPNPTRASLAAALGRMERYDLGGMEMGFGPGDRTGLDYAELSLIDSRGQFVR